MRSFLPAILLLHLLAGCASSPGLERFEYTRLTMGVEARMVLYAPGKSKADAASNAAYDRLAQLDAVMSDYRHDSELIELCHQPAGTPVHVSDDLFTVISIAQRVSLASGGAFDITVGPLVKLWREARETHELPSPEQIMHARRHVGSQHISLDTDAQTVTLDSPGAAIELDLGGIGKGYAAHEAITTLRAHGINSALVALAGDIAVSEAPPGADGWTIAIDHSRESAQQGDEVAAVSPSLAGRGPGGGSNGDRGTRRANSATSAPPTPQSPPSREGEHRARTRLSQHVLILTNASVSTSGSNQQFITIDGTRYSHLVDPRTGLGLTTETIVTVIAHDPDSGGAFADALSSAACVLGHVRGNEFVTSFRGCKAIFNQP